MKLERINQLSLFLLFLWILLQLGLKPETCVRSLFSTRIK